MRQWAVLFVALMCCCIQSRPLDADQRNNLEALIAVDEGIFHPYTSSNDEIVSVKMIPEMKAISPGKPLWVCLQFDIAPEWHLYWKNPGETGAPPSVKWTLPSGFRAGDILWPAPEQIEIDNAVLFGYSNQLLLLVPIYPPDSLSEKTKVDIKAEVSWLGCGKICVPGNAVFSTSLSVKSDEVALNRSAIPIFKKARSFLPVDDTTAVQASLKGSDSQIEIVITGDVPFFNVSKVFFFPEEKELFDVHLVPSWKVVNQGRQLVIEVPSEKTALAKLPFPLHGIVLVEKNGGDTLSWAVTIPSGKVSVGEISAPIPEEKKLIENKAHIEALEKEIWYRQLLSSVSHFIESDFFKILVLAFFGGLILNVMPCVLPVISLKLLHFVQLREQSRKAVMKHGLSYLLGVLVAFWGLVGTIYLLQAFGRTVGWGFQLQEPIFVAILLIILFIFSLSLFGIFEFFPTLASAAGGLEYTFKTAQTTQGSGTPSLMSSFLSGVLAAFVASPCTGPLLGSAIGFAATLEPVYSFLIFSSLAVGLALPFLLVAFIPGAAKLIPRPGHWMVAFKQLMGFFMLATCLWLAWVLDAETEGLSIMTMLITLYIIGFGVWVYGAWGGLDRSRNVRRISRVISLLIVLYGSYVLISTVQKTRMLPQTVEVSRLSSSQIVGKEWEPFSTVLLERLVRQGVPVFVSGTAKWCLTCQSNHVVLDSEKVKEAFIQYGVVKLEADWTNGDEHITKYIRSLGRNGVPLAVVYSRNPKEPPRILPEVITPDIVIEALKWAHEERK